MANLPGDALPYTTTDAVRGYLGMDAEDIPEALLLAQDLGEQILVDLDEWLPTHATVYADRLAGDDQAKRFRWLKQYSGWYGAWLLANAPLAFIQKFTDGKTELQRFAKPDFRALSKHASGQAQRYRQLLLDAVAGSGASAGVSVFIGVSVPNYDPITG
jgi:hypothetical protein